MRRQDQRVGRPEARRGSICRCRTPVAILTAPVSLPPRRGPRLPSQTANVWRFPGAHVSIETYAFHSSSNLRGRVVHRAPSGRDPCILPAGRKRRASLGRNGSGPHLSMRREFSSRSLMRKISIRQATGSRTVRMAILPRRLSFLRPRSPKTVRSIRSISDIARRGTWPLQVGLSTATSE